MRVVVGASSFSKSSNKAINMLKKRGMDVELNPYGRKLTKEETIDFVREADGLLAGLEILDSDIFSNAPKLRAIARIGIGMENVSINEASKYGIRVSNTPDAPTEAVAEMALTCLLSLSRGIIHVSNNLHCGKWEKEIGYSLHGKTIFFIGYGRIGQAFSELLKPFELNVLFSDPQYSDKSVSLEKGIACADIISIHASGNQEILGHKQFELMKNGVIILNCARGIMINENCLHQGLKSGLVRGAWTDVFEEEPYSGQLCECENIILTPHISTYTDRCRENMEVQAVQNLIRDLNLGEKEC